MNISPNKGPFQKKTIPFQPIIFQKQSLLVFEGSLSILLKKETPLPPLAIFWHVLVFDVFLQHFKYLYRLQCFGSTMHLILAKLPLTFSRKARDWVFEQEKRSSPQGLTPWIFTARRRPEPVPAPMPPQTPEAQVPSWWVRHPEIWRWLMATVDRGSIQMDATVR